MIGNNIYLRYLWYIIRHKWFVMMACFDHGLYWRGIIHDISKFRPSEFIPYARYFYGEKRDITHGQDSSGYYKAGTSLDDAFNFAWLLHQKRNRHHWQWWVLPLDDGGNKIVEMDHTSRNEMICDWTGAGRAISGRKDWRPWYEKNKGNMVLGELTRAWVERKQR